MGALFSRNFVPRPSGIILAGGKSSRMGSDKASLAWGDSDILHRQLTVLATVCDELIVVSNELRYIRFPAVRVVADRYGDCGPLGGLEAGLAAAQPGLCFVVACDMPFLDAGSVSYISQTANGVDAAVPLVDNRWHPLYAAYQTTCLPVIRLQLKAGRLRMSELLSIVRVRTVAAEELLPFSRELLMLQNINTPDEWEAVRRL
ncbi:MAG: Molybdopterin-guanine dinucleotide biosynthesis protein [Anaerosporomusa subterranea]|nr:Molybdopterin-guanine dinucleotide biosynthesis protein [Anaerosporomusa subterranea]